MRWVFQRASSASIADRQTGIVVEIICTVITKIIGTVTTKKIGTVTTKKIGTVM
jgi:hypothetical protein